MDNLDDFSNEVHERLYTAFSEAARHKRSTKDECQFELALHENLTLLYDDIMFHRYHPSPGIAFVVTDPVVREIFAAPFRDRVVHHFLFDLASPWWETRLSHDAYSCRKGKGTMFGIRRLEERIRKVSLNYTRRVYVAKFDIQSYFMSLPRRGLYERILWGLDRQFPDREPMYDLLKYLWYEIIFDDPTKGVRKRGSKEKWDKLLPEKSLFNQPPGRGIVIGNLSSQLLSNIFLDPFDRFIQLDLGYKAYGRYVDDFYIVVAEEELPRLKRDVKIFELKLAEMGLTLHPKKRTIQEASKGTPFLGTVVYPGYIVPGRRILHNFEQAVLEYKMGLTDKDSIISYVGLIKHYNSGTAIRKILDRNGLNEEELVGVRGKQLLSYTTH